MGQSVFSNNEIACSNQFDRVFKAEIELYETLFAYLESFVRQINGKIKDTDRPRYTVEILLVYNLTLFASTFVELRNGYLGVSQSILRSITENLTMSMYYWDFPDHEKKYRDNTKGLWSAIKAKGYSEAWMDLALARIDREGNTFRISENKNGSTWQKLISRNLMDEASSFLHQNFEYIQSLVYEKTEDDVSKFIYGPHFNEDMVMKNGLWKILEALIFEIAIFDKIFGGFISNSNLKLVGDAVDKLNKWKMEYNNFRKIRQVAC